jgi:hypothetical protein
LTHVEPGQLVDLARGLIDEGQAAAWRPHLGDCDRCRAVLDHLSLVVRAARAASAPPATAVRGANALATAPPTPASGAIAARLVFDDIAEPLTAGVRGTAQARHLLFEADQWAIDLRVVRSDRALNITGQLANAAIPTQGCAGVTVLAWSTDGVVGRGLTGSLGEFTIACPDVASLTLEIRSSPAITIGIPPART